MSLPTALAISAPLVIIATSYYQTVHGYPSGGGANVVAHDNLGIWPGLVAATALLTDCVLTVAVSVTAGVAVISSALPSLLEFRVPLCLSVIVLVAWGNLRGVRETRTLLPLPTCDLVPIVLTVIAVGLIQLAGGA